MDSPEPDRAADVTSRTAARGGGADALAKTSKPPPAKNRGDHPARRKRACTDWRNLRQMTGMGQTRVSPAELFIRAAEIFDEVHRTRDPAALDECVSLYHRAAELTWSVAGIGVRASGRAGVRKAILEVLSTETRQRHSNLEVVADDDSRAVVRYTITFETAAGTPLVSVPVECEVVVREDLIGSVRLQDRSAPAAAALWPIGSTISYDGEIIGNWADEKLLVRLFDGRAIEVPTSDEMADQWKVGDSVTLFCDQGTVVGWYLPQKQLGVDLRGSDGETE